MNSKPLLAFLAALFVLRPGCGAAAEGVKVGDTFPELKSFELEGALPETLKGKVVLVDFWASWCAPCKASFPLMADLHKRHAGRGLVVLAISVDEQKPAMERFLKKNPVPFTVVRDARQKLAAAVNARTMPTSFLLDAHGRVRFIHHGFKDDTARQYEKEIDELLKNSSPSATP